ncbi:MAG: glycerophosphodiester phosphodiesterase [Anaerolineales bacterium]
MKRSLLRYLTGLLLGIALLIAILWLLARPAAPHPFFTGSPPRPWVIAHQGGDGLWPGDTLFALQNAEKLGVDVLEMDIHASADGIIVLMHDETVDRTTDGTGLIKEQTFAELQTLDAGYDWSPDDGATYPFRGQGIQITSLEEVFQAFPQKRMNIEIKQVDPPIAEEFCGLIRQYNMQERVLVASFHTEAMRAFRQACPEVATSGDQAEITRFFVLNTLFLGGLVSPDYTSVQVPEYSSGLHVLTPHFVRGAHGRGLEVHVWTVNQQEEMARFLDLGVDGIITDYPDRLLALLDRSP